MGASPPPGSPPGLQVWPASGRAQRELFGSMLTAPSLVPHTLTRCQILCALSEPWFPLDAAWAPKGWCREPAADGYGEGAALSLEAPANCAGALRGMQAPPTQAPWSVPCTLGLPEGCRPCQAALRGPFLEVMAGPAEQQRHHSWAQLPETVGCHHLYTVLLVHAGLATLVFPQRKGS